MCLETTRTFEPDGVGAAAAAQFAGATVIAGLGAEDWQISQDAEAAVARLVAALGGRATEVTVTIHRDHLEVVVCGGGRMERHLEFARAPFRTAVPCHLD